MDMVYLVKNDPENDTQELRYSLRSLQNLPHNKVYIIGDKPHWIKNIIHIPIPQIRSKKENVEKNLFAALNNEKISPDFIIMNDDFFIMKPMDKIPALNLGGIGNVMKQYQERYLDGSEYIDTMVEAYKNLTAIGYDNPISFELHIPMKINRPKALELYANVENISIFQFRSYYGNYAGVRGETVPDVKVFLDNSNNSPVYVENPKLYLMQQNFLSVTGGSFKQGRAGKFIRESFLEKSIYEI